MAPITSVPYSIAQLLVVSVSAPPLVTNTEHIAQRKAVSAQRAQTDPHSSEAFSPLASRSSQNRVTIPARPSAAAAQKRPGGC